MARIYGIAVLLLFVLMLWGCKDKPRNPVEEYGDALMDAYERSQDTADAANLEVLKKAVAVYRASNGRYPASLEELAAFTGADMSLDGYDYDPETGKVTLKEW